MSPITAVAVSTDAAALRHDAALRAKANELETAFLAEMLGFGGLGGVPATFGGGAGEEQFASFLRQEQAKLMVEKGGIGLGEMIFESLKARETRTDEHT